MLRTLSNMWAPPSRGLGVILGVLVSSVDLHHNDVQMPALLLIPFVVLLIGLSIRVEDAIATATGYDLPYPPPSPRASVVFLPFAFAAAGPYGGRDAMGGQE